MSNPSAFTHAPTGEYQSVSAESPPVESTPRRAAMVVLLCAVTYYVAARLGYAAMVGPFVVIWFPSGIMLAALSLLPTREWAWVVLGGVVGNFVADLHQRLPLTVAVEGTLANALEVVLAAYVVRRLAGERPTMGRLRDFAVIGVGAAIVSNAFTSFVGSLVLQHGWSFNFAKGWFVWWVGDGMGMLLITPLILSTVELVRTTPSPRAAKVVEALGVLGAVAVVSRLLMLDVQQPGSVEEAHRYLILPLVIWAGVRFGPWGATASSTVLALVALWTANQSPVVFSAADQTDTAYLFEISSYIALSAVSAMIPASILAEQWQAKTEAMQIGERLREMAETIDDAFFIVEQPGGRPLYTSHSWGTIWGRPLEEGYDPRVWFNAIYPEDRPAMAAAMATSAKGGQTEVVARILRPDGTLRWIRSKSFAVRDAAGVVRRVVGVARDITDLRDAEQRVLQAQKMEAVGRLAGGVAHDFNNILTVILAEAEFLRASAALSTNALDSVNEIQHSAESAAALTRQLLAFSRRQIVEPRLFDVNVAVEQMSKMLPRLIGEDIHLELRLSPDVLGVRMDPGQLEQVVANLVVNARDAMPRGGLVTVETVCEPPLPSAPTDDRGSVVLTVRDTGTGMSDEVMAQAFEPFYTTKPLGTGTGLGLATCHSIVNAAGGRIELSSVIGRGTAVRVVLPLVKLDEGQDLQSSEAPSPRGSETVLLVEDETGVRKVTARMLRAQGYDVLEARDARDALDQLQRSDVKVNLLLTDVVLPGMGGRELSDIAQVGHPEMRTLFASGYTDDVILKNQLLANDSVVLQKPFSADALARRVREVLDSPAQEKGESEQ